MRLLINENIPLASVAALRKAGHDVVSITERSPGISDESVMAIAHKEQRILVTFDRDYGELVFRRRLPMPAGVLYLRFLPASPSEPAEYLARLITAGIELEGKFTTGDREQVRQRPMQPVEKR
jgi:predicted nuclease of predicted toxin-antitoxin system